MNSAGNKKRFGTDGIRGLANQGSLGVDEIVRLGEATALILGRAYKKKIKIGMGWDTRVSSPALAHALTAGLSSGGADVYRFGVIPTPAVARLSKTLKYDGGIVISASHNPAADNGIKFFNQQGDKLPDYLERAIEKQLDSKKTTKCKHGTAMGLVQDFYADGARQYRQAIVKHFEKAELKSIKVIVDLANGATCRTVPGILADLKITARFIGDKPDGLNINEACGSLHPEKASRLVKKLSANIGMAFDGDGDRVMLIDETGRILNGDRQLTILAEYYKKKGQLKNNVIVSTVMSNLAMEFYLQDKGIRLLRAEVGDRFVAQMMEKNNAVLGGEQSGHMLLPKLTTTGDGLVTALEVLRVMHASNQPLSQLAGEWENFPQILINVPVAQRPELMRVKSIKHQVQVVQKQLGKRGRINLRYSGTEPLVRVMVEAEDKQMTESLATRMADVVTEAIGNGQKRRITWLTCA